MTPETVARLLARQEQLVELFLVESDPAGWPGAGVAPTAMDKSTRGDRVWVKRDAAASLALATRIGGFIQTARDREVRNPELPPLPATEEVEDDLQAEIANAEREAERMMSRAVKKAATAGKG